MLAPLVMDLADKKIPVKIVSLGHRSGAVIMVRTDSPYQHFQRARRQAHRDPEPLRRRLPVPAQDAGAGEHDARRHRDRRDAAARHAGGAVRERGRRLLHRRAVRRGGAARGLRAAAAHDARRVAQLHLLRAHRARGADRRRTARWCRTSSTTCSAPASGSTPQQANRDKAVADRRRPRVLQPGSEHPPFVMENPTDRVTYGDLRMIRAEFEELMQLSIEAGTIKHPIPYETYVDESFAQARAARGDRALSAPCARSRAARAAAARCSPRRRRGRRRRSRPACSTRRAPRPTSRCAAPTAASSRSAATAARSSLLGFGFTSCPDVCPTTLATLAQARKKLGAAGERRAGRLRHRRSRARRRRAHAQVPARLRPDASSAAPARARAARSRAQGVRHRRREGDRRPTATRSAIRRSST